jgi:hypothetical protein
MKRIIASMAVTCNGNMVGKRLEFSSIKHTPHRKLPSIGDLRDALDGEWRGYWLSGEVCV